MPESRGPHASLSKAARSPNIEMSDAHERWIRYVNTIVAEIDLTEGTAEQRKELGHALQFWEEQHPEISEIKGLNELLGGHYPPLVPSGPIFYLWNGPKYRLPNHHSFGKLCPKKIPRIRKRRSFGRSKRSCRKLLSTGLAWAKRNVVTDILPGFKGGERKGTMRSSVSIRSAEESSSLLACQSHRPLQ